MVIALIASALVFLPGNAFKCIVRFHDDAWCKNTGDDVIDTFEADGKGKAEKFIWKSGKKIQSMNEWGGYFDVPGHWHDEKISIKLQERTSAISFDGDCQSVEIFDQGADVGYSDNCRIWQGDIVTHDACYWSCGRKSNCGGGTKGDAQNCVTMRHDLHHDVGGVYIISSWGDLFSRMTGDTVPIDSTSRLVIAGVSVGLIAAAVVGVAMCYKRGKNELEEPMII